MYSPAIDYYKWIARNRTHGYPNNIPSIPSSTSTEFFLAALIVPALQ